ncbi:uncharacterized protein LOC126679499 [Mercurialis annua]|uniref:uncharacterized protein LOC126679499 n=1 Tax=Mercurialis annua TaxID=3986 RepID=UPI00215F1C4E|nr:uncharacterized protein LOC126679499 [Mercurialis annua]
MPDSAHSLPVLSEEPPHARNWFSSYVYESPLLDTLGDLKGSVAGESEYKKEGFASEESELVKEGNLEESRNSWSSNELVDFGDGNMCTNVFANPIENPSLNKPLSEIPDSSNSFSNLSEPPDIKNWFFSYAYESPESNVFADKESESEEDDSANQQDNKAKCKSGQTGTSDEIAFDETLKSNGSLKFNRSLRDEEENNSMDEGNKAPPARISTPKSITWNLKSTSPTEDVLPPVSEESVRKSHCGSNGKENQGIEVAGNGFVTTKKNRGRENDENSMPKPHKILSECSTKNTKKASDGKDAMKRKVLSERTNFEAECNDVTGKWKCPQKSKPNTGPPLKQLRLERWVHRL